MDAYAFALALGTAGLTAMTALGLHHRQAPGRFGHGHQSSQVHSGGLAGHHHHGAGHQHHAGASSRLLLFLSPRLWFSLLVGFGETAVLLDLDGQVVQLLGVLTSSERDWNRVISREPGGAA